MRKEQADIKTSIKNLPCSPGIYQYYDEAGKLLYVGKAKNLRNRVKSYFSDKKLSGKTAVMVSKIRHIEYIVVNNEYEALLLENNLIKKYQPRYNIMLKDDKTYPWICIRNERFPRINPTRTLVKDGSEYFGPYASGRMMHTLLDLIYQLYQIRSCAYALSEENIKRKKYRLCLKYHIGNCKGPCEGLQTEEEYNDSIAQIRNIIKGNIFMVQQQLKKNMLYYAGRMEFEKAQIIKEKTELLQKYQSKSTVVSAGIQNADVFSIIEEKDLAYVNYLKVISGAIVQAHTVEVKNRLEEPKEKILSLAIADIRGRLGSNSSEIILPCMPEIKIPGVKLSIPKKGDRKKLLEMSENNARYYKKDREKQRELADPERHTQRILKQMMSDLRLQAIPGHIECFDNSNIQGTYPVAALVVFINAKPDKAQYRHFNIKTVTGPDDYSSMQEVVYRRYKRMLDENQPLPDLIIVDGGKGQLNAALKSLAKLDLNKTIPVIGIAKKLEEIYMPGDPLPLYLDKKSETIRLIQQIRDETHRFGISHHRNKREKAMTDSVLNQISGIGFETSQKLLRKFKSVSNIKKASEEELQKIAGKARARIITEYFKNQ